MKEMYFYITITQDKGENIDYPIMLRMLSHTFLGRVDPKKLPADHILALVAHLGLDGWICTPIGNSVNAFWCYRSYEDWEDEKIIIRDLKDLTIERV